MLYVYIAELCVCIVNKTCMCKQNINVYTAELVCKYCSVSTVKKTETSSRRISSSHVTVASK